MARNTGIGWATATWNPWMGCTKVTEGCKNCYMFREQKGYGKDPTKIRRSKTTFHDPIKWKEHERIFVCSWSDFFHEDIPDEWRLAAWDVIRQTPQHTYMFLTKRPQFIRQGLPKDWMENWKYDYRHVWLGVSVELQKYIHRVDTLLSIPAMVHLLSAEPLLGPLDLRGRLTTSDIIDYGYAGLDWVIVGGESDPNKPRKMEEACVYDLQSQCLEDNIPFYFKQWGGSSKKNKVWGGDALAGSNYKEIPHEISS